MTAAAEKLGISRAYLHNLCTGKKTPAVDLMIRIERVTGVVRFEDWRAAAERSFEAHASKYDSAQTAPPSQSSEESGALL